MCRGLRSGKDSLDKPPGKGLTLETQPKREPGPVLRKEFQLKGVGAEMLFVCISFICTTRKQAAGPLPAQLLILPR